MLKKSLLLLFITLNIHAAGIENVRMSHGDSGPMAFGNVSFLQLDGGLLFISGSGENADYNIVTAKNDKRTEVMIDAFRGILSFDKAYLYPTDFKIVSEQLSLQLDNDKDTIQFTALEDCSFVNNLSSSRYSDEVVNKVEEFFCN